MVQVTISWGMTLGIRCRKIRRETLMPQASVAVMNSCSRSDRICPRTSRAMEGQLRKPRINIRYSIRIWGSTCMASMAEPRMIIRGVEGMQ